MIVNPVTATILIDAKQELMLYFKSGLGFFWADRDADDPEEEMAYVDPQASPAWACYHLERYRSFIRHDVPVAFEAQLTDNRYCRVWDIDAGDFRLFHYLSGGEVNCG